MYSVYKVTNLINQKFYIGVHKSKNPYDNYFGSGRAIKKAIKKYGKNNFTKEILYITEKKLEAYEKERQLTIDFIQHSTYNMRQGGNGGFTPENAKKGFEAVFIKYGKTFYSNGGKAAVAKGYGFGGEYKDARTAGKKGGQGNRGRPKSEEHRKKLSIAIKRAWSCSTVVSANGS